MQPLLSAPDDAGTYVHYTGWVCCSLDKEEHTFRTGGITGRGHKRTYDLDTLGEPREDSRKLFRK